MSRKTLRRWRVSHILLALFVIALVIFLIPATSYVSSLDRQVRTQFEGKRWALPARVYARPLELFEGMSLSADTLAAELADLGYARTTATGSPGTFQHAGNKFNFVTRAFRFWDSSEPSLSIRIEIRDNKLLTLQDTQSAETAPLVRLDPVVIGSIYPAHNEDRVLVLAKDVPPLLIKTLVAVEDQRFFQHHGVDPLALVRAMLQNLRAGATVQGGSTLTQQLVKNFYLTSQRTISRKANEAIMAILLEAHYSKEEILSAYLNEIFLGQEGQRAIHGFGLASYFYFARPIDQLTLPQFALLVSLARGASYYDPRKYPERSLARRNRVLDSVAANGVISAAQATAAKATPLGVIAKAPSGLSPYPAFMELVRRQLQTGYKEEDLNSEGLQIFTTLDPRIQKNAEALLNKRTKEMEKPHKIPVGLLEGAVLVTSHENGEVLAMVGGKHAGFSGFNRALDARRPIGSLVKPAVYLTALLQPQEFTLATLLNDGPLSVPNPGGRAWKPQNYDRKHHGNVPLHTALANSYNIPTVRLGMMLGVPTVLETLKGLGVQRQFPDYPSVLLGALDLSPFEVTQAYQTIASGGFRVPLRAIREVLTAQGEPLQHYPLSIEQAFDTGSVFLLTTALQEVVTGGTARSVIKQLPKDFSVAGKTGTTDDLRDSWFAGFSGQHLAVVWLGRDDNGPTGLTGATGALKVWGDIMNTLASQPLTLAQPENVEFANIDKRSARLVGDGCGSAIKLPFIFGSAPTEAASCGYASNTEPGFDDGYDRYREPQATRPGRAERPRQATRSRGNDRPRENVRPRDRERPRSSENPMDWLQELMR